MRYSVSDTVNFSNQLVNGLHNLGIQSVLVEGGAQLLQSFINEGLWDEARIITNLELAISNGLPAPVLSNHQLAASQTILSDVVSIYMNTIG